MLADAEPLRSEQISELMQLVGEGQAVEVPRV